MSNDPVQEALLVISAIGVVALVLFIFISVVGLAVVAAQEIFWYGLLKKPHPLSKAEDCRDAD